MALTCGFFNSLNHDRKYDATQFGHMFDGLIVDGVFGTVGDKLIVSASSGMTVKVGTGRAWFNLTWTWNDSDYLVTAEPSEAVLNRIDTLVLEVNSEDAVRDNIIKFVKGTPTSGTPAKPILTNTETVHQHPLAHVTINHGVEQILQENIENVIGTSECPFVTAPLEKISADIFLANWQDEFDNWKATIEQNQQTWSAQQQADFETFKLGLQRDMRNFEEAFGQQATQWMAELKEILDQNTAGNLLNLIQALEEMEFNHHYDIETKTVEIIPKGDGTKRFVEISSDMVATTNYTKQPGTTIFTTLLEPTTGSFNYERTVNIAHRTGGGKVITQTFRKLGKT